MAKHRTSSETIRRYGVLLLIACALFSGAPAAARAQRRTAVDSVRLITSDVARFWKAIDNANQLDLDARLRDDYLAPASPGLRAFAERQIGSAFTLARTVWQRRVEYDRVRPATMRVARSDSAIRSTLHAFTSLYPDAVLLDVYFVIGAMRIGGWTSGDTLVVAAEMYPDSAMLPRIVAHELVHRQQPPGKPDPTLLEQSFGEGAADFIGELAAGGTINPAAQQYGQAHEHELWRDFSAAMRGHDFGTWLYTNATGDRPADLGYFFGYRIAQAYYDGATDKRAAIREIIRTTDVEDLLRRSGYAP